MAEVEKLVGSESPLEVGQKINEIIEKGTGGGGLEIGDIGFTQTAIDETKGLRRKLNGQLIVQDQYVELTNKIKATQALNPDLFCTESEWQTAVTMSANGVCYKYVIDDNAGTIRLPKYPEYLDLSINTSAVSKTVSIKGNGNAMGFMGGADGAVTGGLVYTSEGFGVRTGMYNQPLATKYSSGEFAINYTAGLTTDASKSGITGTVSIPAVQSEKIKGTYFIQVATGAETEDNIINEIELNNPFSLLDYKYSEYELNNISWLRSNGQYNSKAVYPAVYKLLLKIYNGTETKAGVSVKLTTEAFTDYDFVLNTAEETFRLPIKVKQKFLNAINGNMPVIGNGMTLGLTNGSENAGLGQSYYGSYRYAMIYPSGYGKPVGSDGGDVTQVLDQTYGVATDPTKSGLVAQVSQSEVSGLYLYFYVGETVQNANLINAGRIEEKLAGKADVTLQNVTPLQDFINDSMSWGIPDYTAGVLLTLSQLTSGGYIAPTKGVIAGKYNPDGTSSYINVNGSLVSGGDQSVVPLYVQVEKNDIMTGYKIASTYFGIYFYPLKGAK